jgi:hypothetical protein
LDIVPTHIISSVMANVFPGSSAPNNKTGSYLKMGEHECNSAATHGSVIWEHLKGICGKREK